MTYKGSAFLEVIISTALLSIFSVLTYSAMASLDASQIYNDQRKIAHSLISSEIEQEIAKSVDEVTFETIVSPTNRLPDGQITKITTDQSPEQPTLYQVEVTVSWQQNGDRQLSSGTIISKQ